MALLKRNVGCSNVCRHWNFPQVSDGFSSRLDKSRPETHNRSVLLLRFRAQNHRSLRDEAELSLVSSSHKGATAEAGWGSASLRVAGIYGANASGKSTVIHALGFFRDAIEYSATTWAGRKSGLPYLPFALDDSSKHAPSTYSADIVIGDVRYEYGFSTYKGSVETEWLYSFPEGRSRILFERGIQHEGGYKFGPTFKGGSAAITRATLKNELFLSRAAATQHPFLTGLHEQIVNGIVVTRFGDIDRQGRLSEISKGLLSGDIEFSDIIALLRMADVGISNLEVSTQEMPEELQEIMKFIASGARRKRNRKESGSSPTEDSEESEATDKESNEPRIEFRFNESLQRNLEFHHEGPGGTSHILPESVQSTGTMSWLALAVPALECLRRGRVLLVDEIDASLHPQLGLALVQMFRDPTTNPRNAQLIFTTHDTYYLSPTSMTPLTDDEVWFAEKTDGATELYSLADFSTRKNENVARRYLSGRYGAVPSVVPSLIASLVARDPDVEQQSSGQVEARV